MAFTFPTSILRSGALTQRPYQSGHDFLTSKASAPCGVSYTWANRNVPLNWFELHIESMTATELATLENFFTSVEGRLQTFSMVDPDGGSHATCRFDSDVLNIKYVQVNEYAVTITITEFVTGTT